MPTKDQVTTAQIHRASFSLYVSSDRVEVVIQGGTYRSPREVYEACLARPISWLDRQITLANEDHVTYGRRLKQLPKAAKAAVVAEWEAGN